MQYDLRPMGIAEILDTAFRVMADNLAPILTLGLISAAPGLVMGLASPDPASFDPTRLLVIALMGLVSLAIFPFVYVGTLRVIADRYMDRETSVGDALGYAASVYWPVVGTMLTTSIIILLWTLLFIIPGLIAALRYTFVYHSVVLEGTAGADARERSRTLTEGGLGQLFLLYIVIGVASAGLNGAVIGLGTLTELPSAAIQVLQAAINAVTSGFSATALVVAYFSARCEKEGFDLQHLAGAISGAAQPGTTGPQ